MSRAGAKAAFATAPRLRSLLHSLLRGASLLAAMLLMSCANETGATGKVANSVAASDRADLRFTELAPGVWMHTATKDIAPYGSIPTNGLIVARGSGDAVLVDTAWNDDQTAAIAAWAEETLGRTIGAAIVTHAHDDKMGGIGALRDAGIVTFAHPLSNTLAADRGLLPADESLLALDDGTMTAERAFEGLSIFYPGPGHTEDNIVVRVVGTPVLFGGCLIRPGASGTLGNTEHADIDHWERAVLGVAARYPDATIIVPSHGKPGGPDLLAHTAGLARAAAAAQRGD